MKISVKKRHVFKRLIWRIVRIMQSDSFLTVWNLKSEKHGSKTMETPLYPGATDGLRRFAASSLFYKSDHSSHSSPLVQRASQAILQSSTFVFVLYNKTWCLAVNEENIPCVPYRMCRRRVGMGPLGDARKERGPIVVDVEVVMNFSPNYP
jgi:hypothetical protein